jgi:hypothetical protein
MKSWYLIPRRVGVESAHAEPSRHPPTLPRRSPRLGQAPPQEDLKMDGGGGRSAVGKVKALSPTSVGQEMSRGEEEWKFFCYFYHAARLYTAVKMADQKFR